MQNRGINDLFTKYVFKTLYKFWNLIFKLTWRSGKWNVMLPKMCQKRQCYCSVIALEIFTNTFFKYSRRAAYIVSAKRTFSCVRRIKTWHSSPMIEEKLVEIASMHMYREIKPNPETIITINFSYYI